MIQYILSQAELYDGLVKGSPSAAHGVRNNRALGPRIGASPCNTHRPDSRA
jgi:hypothetical protein